MAPLPRIQLLIRSWWLEAKELAATWVAVCVVGGLTLVWGVLVVGASLCLAVGACLAAPFHVRWR